MSRDDRLARLLRVHNLLGNTPRGLRAEEVARHCEISRRTAYRDLVALQEAKYPIRNEGGRVPGACREGLVRDQCVSAVCQLA
jgi:predicted DNA-binding transcriptional regulator YafY